MFCERGLSARYPPPILTAFEISLNTRESVFACVHWQRISEFLRGEFYRSKTAKMGTFEGVFVIKLQLK